MTAREENLSDHDRLIEIHTTVKNLVKTTNKIIQDHETRLREHKTEIDRADGERSAQSRRMNVYAAIGILATGFIGLWDMFKK